jgi:hypothetical protein
MSKETRGASYRRAKESSSRRRERPCYPPCSERNGTGQHGTTGTARGRPVTSTGRHGAARDGRGSTEAVGLMIHCSPCRSRCPAWCRSAHGPVSHRCSLADGRVVHRWRRCVRDLVHGTRTGSSKAPSTRVDSAGARPRALGRSFGLDAGADLPVAQRHGVDPEVGATAGVATSDRRSVPLEDEAVGARVRSRVSAAVR